MSEGREPARMRPDWPAATAVEKLARMTVLPTCRGLLRVMTRGEEPGTVPSSGQIIVNARFFHRISIELSCSCFVIIL